MKTTKELIESNSPSKEIVTGLKERVTLDTFVQLAKVSDSVSDFIRRVRQIKPVPQYVAQKFQDEYGQGGKLSIEQAAKNFFTQHH